MATLDEVLGRLKLLQGPVEVPKSPRRKSPHQKRVEEFMLRFG